MKLTIDTYDKTVEVEGQAKLSEVIEFLKKAVNNWEMYSILRNHNIVPYYYGTISPDLRTGVPVSAGIMSISG